MTIKEIVQRLKTAMDDAIGQESHLESWLTQNEGICDAIDALKELDKTEQEPVAYGMWDTMLGYGGRMMMVRLDKGQDGCTVPLYTAPAQRKPLSNEEIYKIYRDCGDLNVKINIARAIEAAHGIKGEA